MGKKEVLKLVRAGEWLEMTPFQTIVSTVHAVRANTAVHPSTMKLPRSSHRFKSVNFFEICDEKEPGSTSKRKSTL